jgi:hypothetical protein
MPQWDQEDNGEDKVDLAPLMPFRADESNPNTDSEHARAATPAMAPTLPITLQHYLALVDWTGRQLKPGKRGRIAETVPPILTQLGADPHEWIQTLAHFNKRFRFAAGALGKLQQWCEAVGRDWVQGGKTAARLYSAV